MSRSFCADRQSQANKHYLLLAALLGDGVNSGCALLLLHGPVCVHSQLADIALSGTGILAQYLLCTESASPSFPSLGYP